jgi:hypothetical protein
MNSLSIKLIKRKKLTESSTLTMNLKNKIKTLKTRPKTTKKKLKKHSFRPLNKSTSAKENHKLKWNKSSLLIPKPYLNLKSHIIKKELHKIANWKDF